MQPSQTTRTSTPEVPFHSRAIQSNWTAAHARLLSLLPVALETIRTPQQMTPISICEAATQAGLPFDFVPLANRWRPDWTGGMSWEDYDKLQLFDVVFEQHPPPPGLLWFIPDECVDREPYTLEGRDLRKFIASWRGVLHYDALFLWCEAPRISVIHHEGGYAHIFAT